MNHPAPVLEVLPRDLSAYRAGNTGVDYVHRFDSGRPGPHVLINALTHGNEICGMVAATHLLDAGVRPKIGTLTVSFAHVEAYAAFRPETPFANRQLVHNLNRIWSDEWLDGPEQSPELRRARELRPVVAAADHILDIHSTSQDVAPFWVYPDFERNGRAALALGAASGVALHLLMPQGLGSGTQRRLDLLQTCMVRTPAFRFTRPLVGLETFAQGELIATDGEAGEIRAPCDDCTVMMPTREPIVGREAVYLTRPLVA